MSQIRNFKPIAPSSITHPPSGTYVIFSDSTNGNQISKMDSNGTVTLLGSGTTIRVNTEAGWAADTTIYTETSILISSDAFYYATDQRKFKVADGVQTWSNLDYMPIGVREQTVVSAATVTPTHLNDLVTITAQGAGLTLANPSGTPVNGQAMIIRILDDGTARAISYGSEYRSIGATLPTTTVISKTVYLGLIFNAADTKWDCIGVSQEA